MNFVSMVEVGVRVVESFGVFCSDIIVFDWLKDIEEEVLVVKYVIGDVFFLLVILVLYFLWVMIFFCYVGLDLFFVLVNQLVVILLFNLWEWVIFFLVWLMYSDWVGYEIFGCVW